MLAVPSSDRGRTPSKSPKRASPATPPTAAWPARSRARPSPAAAFMTGGALAAGGIASAAFGLPALGFALGPMFEDGTPENWQDVGPEADFNAETYVPKVTNIVPEIGEAGKTTVYVRKFDPGATTQRQGQGAAALRGDLHPLRAPGLPGPLHPGLAALRVPVSRRRLRLRGQGRRRPAGAPARPLLHPRDATAASRWASASRSTPSSSASRRATRRTTSTGCGSTSTRRGRAHEQARPDPRPASRAAAPRPGQRRKPANGNGANGNGNGGIATKLREGAAEGGATVVGWLDERTGASPFLRGFLFRKVPKGTNWFYTLGLGHDVRLRLPGRHRRLPGDVLRARTPPAPTSRRRTSPTRSSSASSCAACTAGARR